MKFRTFLNNLYSQEKKIPDWVKSALELAKIDITLEHPFVDTNEFIYKPNEEIKEYLANRRK